MGSAAVVLTSSKVRRAAINGGLVVLSTLVTLVLAEVVLRQIAPPPKSYPLPRNLLVQKTGYRTMTPNFRGVMDNGTDYRAKVVTADEKGRRTVPDLRSAEQQGKTIHIFGDSQTFGQGLADNETWPNRLQVELGSKGNKTVRVLNYGVPAINIGHYRARLLDNLQFLRGGDLVVVGMTWNDIVSAGGEADATQLVRGYMVKGREASADKDPNRQAPETASPGWRLRVFEATGMAMPKYHGIKDFLLRWSRVSALVNFLLPHIRGLYYAVREPVNPYQSMLDKGTPEKNFWLLLDMKKKVEAVGGYFLVVMLPNRLLVEDRAYNNYTQGGKFMSPRNYLAHLAQPLCDKFQITCVDTFRPLTQRQSEPLYFPGDGHYTPVAADIVAQAVSEAVGPYMGNP